ncbi:hypothetical protein HanLR1_Chr05g0193961 [Helianthus annuus]|nr:hypothetical protein HanLR1_Chr05g0193961 [Helianthus annuus]
MHHVVALIAERQGVTCTNRLLSRLLSVMCLMSKAWCKSTIEPGVSLEAASLFLRGRGKAAYILPSSDPTFALLLVGFTPYNDDDDGDMELWEIYFLFLCRTAIYTFVHINICVRTKSKFIFQLLFFLHYALNKNFTFSKNTDLPPSGLPFSHDKHNYPPQNDMGGANNVKDTETIGSAYDRYLQSAKLPSGDASGGIAGMHSLPLLDPVGMARGGPMGPDLAAIARAFPFDHHSSLDLMARPPRETLPLPADASSTIYIEGLPSNCTRREVARILWF